MSAPLQPLRITKTGGTVASGVASASASLPTDSAGLAARYVRVTATAAAYVKVGKGAQTAAAGDTMVQPGDSILLNVVGLDTIAAIQVSAAGTVQFSAVENG